MEQAEVIAALPDDGLAEVLRVLPPQSLAVARCVCKAWRDLIDGRALLHPHLLPRSVRGVFINYIDHKRPHLFARPAWSSTFPGIDGMLSFLPNDPDHDWWKVLDHSNGLVLCSIEWGRDLVVCNPATQSWTQLPNISRYTEDRFHCAYIAFDPAVSPHYEVFLIPEVPRKPGPAAAPLYRNMEDAPYGPELLFSNPEEDDPCRLMELPPSPWSLKVFSSSTGSWEDKLFVRDGQPAGTVEDMRSDPFDLTFGPRQRYAVYQNGGLYVHCQGSFMARFSLSTDKYQVIKMPEETERFKPYLGGSRNEVYFGIVTDDDYDSRQLRVWKLSESCGCMEWLLKYEIDIGLYANYLASMPYNNCRQPEGAWWIEEDYDNESGSDYDTDTGVESAETCEWDSDKDDIFTVEAGDAFSCSGWLNILGFHPYKEVVFLVGRFGVASYHFSGPKIQYLGNSRPRSYYRNHSNGIYESFIYTPCMIGDLLHKDDDTGYRTILDWY